MRTSKFTVEQIAHPLRRAESGTPVAEICRELGTAETTFYRWQQKFHGWAHLNSASSAGCARRTAS